jgi:N-acetylglucosamine-6-sulfatase
MNRRAWSWVAAIAVTASCQRAPLGTPEPPTPTVEAPPRSAPSGESARPQTTAAIVPRGDRPNIVFVLADDFSMNLVPYMPHVVEMQNEGTTFTNYFVTDSLCCPSRSTIFTGKFPHNTGVTTNAKVGGGYDAFLSHGNEAHTFAVALQQAGYKTAMMGKYLNGYQPDQHPVPPGWTEWDVAGFGYAEFNYSLNENGKVVSYGSDPKDYLTDVVAGKAALFIRKASPGPFFLETATFAPHGSRGDAPPTIPAPRDADLFPGLKAPRTGAYGVSPDADAPTWLKQIPPLLGPMQMKLNEFFRRRVQAVQAIDKMVGEIRATLAASGDSNTYVVFSSDNGLHLGEYSLRPGKMTAYEIDIHVPLIVVGPGVARGKTVTAFAENVDLCSTFTELAQSSGAPTQPDGHSLVSLLRGGSSADWRRVVLVEHHRPGPDATDPDAPMPNAANPTSYAAIRTEGALYVEYETGEVEYHDLARDPDEIRNTASSLPPDRRKRLHEILRANVDCKGVDSCWAAQRMAP